MNALILPCGRIRKLGKSSYNAFSPISKKFNKCMFCMLLVCVWLVFWQDQDQNFISAVPTSHKLHYSSHCLVQGDSISVFTLPNIIVQLPWSCLQKLLESNVWFVSFLWFDSDTKNHPQIFEVFESLSESEYKFVWRCPIVSKMENGVKSHLEF